MVGGHHQNSAVSLDHNKIPDTAENHGVTLCPHNAILSVVSEGAPDQDVSIGILGPYPGERLPGADVIPGEGSTYHRHGRTALEQAHVNRDRGDLPEELR